MSDTNKFTKIPRNRQPYAKPKAETFSVQVNTKITPSMNEEFNQICKALNRTPAEWIRHLIQEEINMWRAAQNEQHDNPPVTTSTRQSDKKDTSSSLYRIPEERQKLSSSTGVRFTYAPWKHPVKSKEGDLYCKYCEDWYSSSTFKQRHAVKHGYLDTKEYIRENIATINREYEKVTGKKPVYDPRILE
jgi:hypothetical protein